MNKILHITPHLGGGVGKALSGIISFEKFNNSEFNHKLLVLEHPENPQFIDICTKNGIEIIFTQELNEIKNEIDSSDIIIIHWWHHPLNAWLLANISGVNGRFILWSHVNGCTYPMLPFKLINRFHKVFFTSKYTFDNPYWNEKEKKAANKITELVYGLGNLENISLKKHKRNNKADFIIGYIGTINFSKLNPNFVEYCNETLKLVPNAKFVLVGNPECKNEILESAKKLKIEDHFIFKGYTKNINATLNTFDVFGYPLNNWHFGTTENSILEAMNAGIPVVIINQCSEKYLIKQNQTGFLANNPKHYAVIMKNLFDNFEQRNIIAKEAKKNLLEEFSMEKNINRMKHKLKDVLTQNKKNLDCIDIVGEKPQEWFLNFLGDDHKTFFNDNIELIKDSKHIFKEKSKSSVHQFYKYFPNDIRLKNWEHIINEK